ncbi:MAG: hypothetical protein AB1540_00385 [Bdellovibrionota bacterium]
MLRHRYQTRHLFFFGLALVISNPHEPYALARGIAKEKPDHVLCQKWTVREWNDFRSKAALTYPRFAYTVFDKVFQKCEARIRALGLTECFKNMKGLTALKRVMSIENGMGFDIPTRQYLAKQPKWVVELPHEFRKGLPKNWKEVAETKGWEVLYYHSSVLDDRDNGRALFYFGDDDRDRWIQFIVYPNGGGQLIDFIGIQKKDKPGGRVLQKPKIFFRDLAIKPPSKKIETLIQTSRCVGCHAGGMRQIETATNSIDTVLLKGKDPDDIPLKSLAQYRLERFNARMQAYGIFDWHGTYKYSLHGPPLGRAHGCVECHNGADRMPLTVSTTQSQIEHKILVERSMPPALSHSEEDENRRREIASKIFEDYVVDVQEWLTKAPCLKD